MKRIPLCAAVLLLFSLLACKNKPAASSDKRPASRPTRFPMML